MYFLIDFENVGNNGMRGAEHLLLSDHIILFYSEFAANIETRYLEDIENSGCDFITCKLVNTRKNALDFYIAAKLGEIFGGGYSGKAVLVSKDKDFKSLRDYFASYASPGRQVYLAESIERGIVSANMADQRTSFIRRRTKSSSIETFISAYEEKRKRRKLLEDIFTGTEYAAHIDALEEMLKKKPQAKILYPAILHSFGRKDGLAIYRMLKEAYAQRQE